MDDISVESVLSRVRDFVKDPASRQIITANPLMLLAAQSHPGLAHAFRSADLIVPDSVGILWAAARQGRRLTKVSGIDLLVRLCEEAAGSGWRVFFLGAAPGVAAAAAEVLSRRFPGLIVAGVEHGYFSAEPHPPMTSLESAVVARVAAARPDLLFVALDTPRQDAWIHANRKALGARVSLGVGGSFDVLSGRLRRAPRWMCDAGLEWLFRLAQEPRRWRRMTGLPRFVIKVFLESRGTGRPR